MIHSVLNEPFDSVGYCALARGIVPEHRETSMCVREIQWDRKARPSEPGNGYFADFDHWPGLPLKALSPSRERARSKACSRRACVSFPLLCKSRIEAKVWASIKSPSFSES